MRRIAFISDVHANLEALEAVLRDVDAQKPDLLVALGDTVNYGPNPRECLQLVDEAADIVLAGNHEKEAALPEPDEMEGDARELLDWTVKQLDGLHAWERMRDDLKARGEAAAQHRYESSTSCTPPRRSPSRNTSACASSPSAEENHSSGKASSRRSHLAAAARELLAAT